MLYPLRDWPDYSITPEGQVWSHKSNRFLKPFRFIPKPYYHIVKLWNQAEGKRRNCYVHTLVGKTFLPYVEGALICHKDEELPFPQIHFLENLWVGNTSDNMKDCSEKGRHGNRHKKGSHRTTSETQEMKPSG